MAVAGGLLLDGTPAGGGAGDGDGTAGLRLQDEGQQGVVAAGILAQGDLMARLQAARGGNIGARALMAGWLSLRLDRRHRPGAG